MAEALARGIRDAGQNMFGMLVPPAGQPQHAQRDESEETSSQPEYGMAPPPDMAFDSREKLLEYLKNWAASQGYAVVIGRSRTNRLWIRCDRGGLYHDKHQDDPSQRQRKRKVSRLTGCEFSVKASMRKDGIWRSRTENGEHNHEASSDLRDHPSLRRMNEEQLQYVYELTEQGLTPADIMTEMTRRWPDIKVIRRDIYNARKNYKSIKEANDEPPREFEDPNGRMPGPTDNGRWAWVEEGDEIKKKRRLGRPPKEREPAAAAAAPNIPSLELPPGNNQFTASLSRSATTPAQTQEPVPSWNRLSGDPSASQSPAISSTSSFQPPPTTSTMPLANRLQSPQNTYSNHSPNHSQSNSTSSFNFGPSNPPIFPQQILAPNPPELAATPSSGPGASTRPSQRQSAQAYIHPNLRTPNGPSGSHSPVTPRHEPATQLANQLQSSIQPPSSQEASSHPFPSNVAPSMTASRPATANVASANNDSAASANAIAALATSQAKPSGAAMIQRLSRVEEELRDQKNELRDQKDLLTKILMAVNSLKGE